MRYRKRYLLLGHVTICSKLSIYILGLTSHKAISEERNAENTTKETLLDGRGAEHSLVPPTHSPLALQTNPNVILPITFSERTLGSLLALVY
jgi:hypothetical protein